MKRGRSAAAISIVVAGLLALAACSTPQTPQRQVGGPDFDPFRSSRTEQFISSAELLTTVKSPPVHVSIARLGVDMRIDIEGLEPNGDMSLPVSPFRAGWYEFGAAPNSLAGATVLAAHVDSSAEGRGPFAALRSAEQGTEVRVTDQAGTEHVYRIVSVEKVDKGEVQWNRYFSLVGEPRLLLITCGGEYDYSVGSYDDNYIVTAEKVS